MTAPATIWHTAPDMPTFAAPLRAINAWRPGRPGAGTTVLARGRVGDSGPNLRCHFPGQPLLPGVFIVEALVQAMAIALPDGPGVLREVRSIRFLVPLREGTGFTLEARTHNASDGVWTVSATVTGDDGTVAARIRAIFGDREAVDA